MAADAARAADTQGWLRRAAADLRGADIDLGAVPPLIGDAVYHCQQAAEKALKAFLTWHDVPFRKTHDLGEIGQQCMTLDRSLEPLCRSAERLTTFAWIFRYPGEPEEPPMEDAVGALELAREVYHAVLSRLPGEIGS
jgi:HEPN domain-containing protein